jgi:hypothetical protein
MQEGGNLKIKVKIKPDRKLVRQARKDKDKMPLNRKMIEDVERDFMKTRSNSNDNPPPSKVMKKGGIAKAKNGKSFPDLNKDGKITKADILKGRGVIAKKGATLKKQAAVAIAMKKDGKTPKKMQYGGAAASMVPPMMKKGGAMKKCKYGCK